MSSGSGSFLVTSFGSSSESELSSGACAPLPGLFRVSPCRGLGPRRSLIVGGPLILFLEDLFDSISRAAEVADEDPQGCGSGHWGVVRPPKCAQPVWFGLSLGVVICVNCLALLCSLAILIHFVTPASVSSLVWDVTTGSVLSGSSGCCPGS